MAIKKAIYKVDNGNGFDEIYFKTLAELVQVSSNKTLNTKLNELDNLITLSPVVEQEGHIKIGNYKIFWGWFNIVTDGSGYGSRTYEVPNSQHIFCAFSNAQEPGVCNVRAVYGDRRIWIQVYNSEVKNGNAAVRYFAIGEGDSE